MGAPLLRGKTRGKVFGSFHANPVGGGHRDSYLGKVLGHSRPPPAGVSVRSEYPSEVGTGRASGPCGVGPSAPEDRPQEAPDAVAEGPRHGLHVRH